MEDLKNGAYKGRDEYPKNVSGAYELLICTSCQIGTYTYQIGWFNYCGRVSCGSNFMYLQNGVWGYRGGHGESENNATYTEFVPGINSISHELVQ